MPTILPPRGYNAGHGMAVANSCLSGSYVGRRAGVGPSGPKKPAQALCQQRCAPRPLPGKAGLVSSLGYIKCLRADLLAHRLRSGDTVATAHEPFLRPAPCRLSGASPMGVSAV